MNFLGVLLSILLLADADIPRAMNLRTGDPAPTPSFYNEELPLFSSTMDPESQGQTPTQHGAKKTTLQESSKLELIRYVSGEFAKAAKSLPAGKEGFLLYVEKPVNQELLQRAVATHGAVVSKVPYRHQEEDSRTHCADRYGSRDGSGGDRETGTQGP